MPHHHQSQLRLQLIVGGVVLLALAADRPGAQALPLAESFAPGAWTKLAGNPVLSPSASGAWDDRFVLAPSVLLDGSTYRMWYAGSGAANSNRRIGYATSPDGLVWTRQGGAPVLSPGPNGSWESAQVGFPSVIKDGDTYKMWYTALDAAAVGRVGYATSADGMTWTKYAGNPVLTAGSTGSWDAAYVGSPQVVKVDGVYHLWYRGGLEGDIGYATSSDGVTWTKSTHNPVIASGSGGWDDAAYHPRVVFDGALFHMWYSGCNPAGDVCQVGYATSSDGAHWTRLGMVLPQGASGVWDDGGADHAAVLLVGTTLKMWYSGYDGEVYRIGYASAATTALDHALFIPSLVR